VRAGIRREDVQVEVEGFSRPRRDAVQVPRAEDERARRIGQAARPTAAVGREQARELRRLDALERQPESAAQRVRRLSRRKVNGVAGREGKVKTGKLESRAP
jgi:hypothetical protein